MNREEYDSTIEPRWKFDRSLGMWSYMNQSFHGPILERALCPKDSEKTFEYFLQISLPSFSISPLQWQAFMSDIPSAKGFCKGFLWNISLELQPMKAPVTDEGQLRSMKWAVSEFTRQVFSLHRSRTLGVVLCQCDVRDLGFYWDLEQIEQFIGWLGDFSQEPLVLLNIEEAKQCLKLGDLSRWKFFASTSLWAKLYSLFILSQYWHYLASGLEEDCPALVELNVQHLTLQQQIFLLARPLFDHVKLIAIGAHKKLGSLQKEEGKITPTRLFSSKLALLIPDKLSFETAGTIGQLIHSLDQSGIDYRLILEQDLVFEWQEIEQLIIWASSVGDQAIRSLRGFKAAAGQVYAIGENPKVSGLSNEWPQELSDLLLTKEGS